VQFQQPPEELFRTVAHAPWVHPKPWKVTFELWCAVRTLHEDFSEQSLMSRWLIPKTLKGKYLQLLFDLEL
jgi:hypothetical protein